MQVAVVIPCHHRADLLARALRAVADWPCVVVDDSPGGLRLDGAVRRVRTSGEEGFGRAANAGLQAAAEAGATHALVLNDDAVPAPGCVEALLSAWGAGVGAAGPLIYGPEGLESAGFDERWWGRVRARRTLGLRGPEPQAVNAIAGTALLVAVEARFDPRYRHGFEDLALCRELRMRGQRILLVPEAAVMHLGGGTVSRTSRAAQRHALSGHLRYLGGGWRGGVAVGLAVGQVLREGGPWDRLAGVAEGVADWHSGGRS